MQKPDDKLQAFYRNLGATVKSYRKARNMTLEELGLQIGLDPASVYNLEKGRNITILTVIKLAVALGKSPADFFRKIPFVFDEQDLEYINKKKNK